MKKKITIILVSSLLIGASVFALRTGHHYPAGGHHNDCHEQPSDEQKASLKAARAEFELQLTDQEKADIQTARVKVAALHAQFSHKKGEHKEGGHEKFHAAKAEVKALVKPIAEAHQSELKELLTGIFGNQCSAESGEQKKGCGQHADAHGEKPKGHHPDLGEMTEEQMKEMWKHHHGGEPSDEDLARMKRHLSGEMTEEDMQAMKEHHQGGSKRHRKVAHFLLMEVDPTVAVAAPFEVEAFPNPASEVINVKYEVTREGQVTIELRNKRGVSVHRVDLGNQGLGEHTESISLSGLKTEELYVVIVKTSAGEVSTKVLTVR
jgi:hypothetical protein